MVWEGLSHVMVWAQNMMFLNIMALNMVPIYLLGAAWQGFMVSLTTSWL